MRKDAATAVRTQPITHQFLTTVGVALTMGIEWIGKDSVKIQVLQNSHLPCFFQLSASRRSYSLPLQFSASSYLVKDMHLHQGCGAPGAVQTSKMSLGD